MRWGWKVPEAMGATNEIQNNPEQAPTASLVCVLHKIQKLVLSQVSILVSLLRLWVASEVIHR